MKLEYLQKSNLDQQRLINPKLQSLKVASKKKKRKILDVP